MGVREDAAAIAGELAELRHAIHREPEIGLELPLTQAKVLDYLDGLPLEVSTGRKLSSVTAVLRGGAHPDAGRGDRDAAVGPAAGRHGRAADHRGHRPALRLPLRGRHARLRARPAHGHAGRGGRLLSTRQAELPGDVIFMFQPGEEGYRGADVMIGEGVLDAAGTAPGRRVRAARLVHPVPVRAVRHPPGTDAGRGRHHPGHRARARRARLQPHLAADPITAACAMVTALQTMVTRRFDVFDPVVVTISSFHAGTTDNVIPDEAAFLGTARSYSAAARDRLRENIIKIINDLADAHGVEADAHYVDEYPVTVNDPAEAEFAQAVVADVFGAPQAILKPFPMTGAEDFSYVLQQVPGAFLSVGAVPLGRDPATAPSNHSAAAEFDDAILADGAACYAELALRRLGIA